MGTGRWMDEDRVAGAIWRFDLGRDRNDWQFFA
jgi:hypothetical protein